MRLRLRRRPDFELMPQREALWIQEEMGQAQTNLDAFQAALAAVEKFLLLPRRHSRKKEPSEPNYEPKRKHPAGRPILSAKGRL